MAPNAHWGTRARWVPRHGGVRAVAALRSRFYLCKMSLNEAITGCLKKKKTVGPPSIQQQSSSSSPSSGHARQLSSATRPACSLLIPPSRRVPWGRFTRTFYMQETTDSGRNVCLDRVLSHDVGCSRSHVEQKTVQRMQICAVLCWRRILRSCKQKRGWVFETPLTQTIKYSCVSQNSTAKGIKCALMIIRSNKQGGLSLIYVVNNMICVHTL